MEDRLQKFARLVEVGNFTKASHELHISQPALSIAIAKLERELHAVLLVRGTRSLTLTNAGRLAYQAAKELHATTTNLTVRLTELARKKLAVSIGMIDSVASGLFVDDEPLSALQSQTHVSLAVNNSRHLSELIIRDQLDIAFIVQHSSITPAAVNVVEIAQEPMVIVCHTSLYKTLHKVFASGILPHFISYDQSSTSYQIITSALDAHDITPQPEFYSTSPDVMLQLLLLQKGAAALPYQLVKRQIQANILSVFDIAGKPFVINRPINRITRQGKTIPEPLVQLTAHVQAMLERQGEELSLRG